MFFKVIFALAGINTGRFLINTTVGILGLVDVASYLGFEEYEKEDYGQSLAVHGVGSRMLFGITSVRTKHC